MGRRFPHPNESLTLETNANHRLAGKTLRTPLLHTHAMVFSEVKIAFIIAQKEIM